MYSTMEHYSAKKKKMSCTNMDESYKTMYSKRSKTKDIEEYTYHDLSKVQKHSKLKYTV